MQKKPASVDLEHVLSVCPAIIYATKGSGDFACTFVSENIKEILGFTQQEMLDDPDFWTGHIHPQDERRVLSEVFRLIGEGGGSLEYRFQHRDGHYRWFQDSLKPVYDETGNTVEIVGSWADITQRKLAESFQTLYQASFKIHEPVGLKKWFDGLLQTAKDVLHLDQITILLADAGSQWLQAVATSEADQPLEEIRIPIGSAGGGIAQAYEDEKVITWDGSGPLPEELELKPPYDEIKAFRSRVFVIVPLVSPDQKLGVLQAGWKGNRPFDPAVIEPLEVLARQAAMASEQSRLYAAAQPVLRRSLRLSDVYPAFAAAVKALVAYDRIGVVVPEKNELLMALSVAEPPLESFQGQSWSEQEGTAGGWVLDNRSPRLVRDLQSEPNLFSDEKFLMKEGVRSTIMLPLLSGAEVVGFFFLDNLTPAAYTERDIELLGPVAQQVALAIQNNRLLKELQEQSKELSRSVEEMDVLRQVGQTVNSMLDLKSVLTSIVTHAVELSQTGGGMIFEYEEENKQFIVSATHGLSDRLLNELQTNPILLGEGAVGRAAFTREPVAFANVEDGTYEPRLRDTMVESGFRAILSVPLLYGNDIFGGLSVCRHTPGEFDPALVNLLQSFATQSVLAIQKARQFHEIEEKGHELEIASKHKSQFLANMSHELRTPLNAILGYTELILDDIYGEVPAKVKETLERIDKNGHHLLKLINDILDLSKIEAGSLKLNLSDYALDEVVRSAITATEPIINEKNVSLDVAIPANLSKARGDERRLTQVLLNLLSNAAKFTDAGEIRLEIAESDGQFRVSVADTGIGIDESEKLKIFEEFYQVDDAGSGKRSGTGLGLPITKRIIEMHGGHIWVDSHPGEGSTFVFTLPVLADGQVDTP
jgi:PAS domain S-box-containing protein